MQRDQADCGVACLLSIIKFYKGNASLEKLREDSGTSKLGTSLLGLSQAAKAVGFNAKGYLADHESLMNIGKPTIIHVTIDAQFEHYMVLFNYVKNIYILGDPGEGILYLTKEQLDKIWLTKRCLILEPNDSFKISSIIKKEKRAWFYKLIKDDSNILLTSVFLGIILSILGMATAIFSQVLIDQIIPSKDSMKLSIAVFFIILLLITRNILQYIRGNLIIKQNRLFNSRIVKYFFDSLLFLPIQFFDSREIGDLVARLNDTSRIQKTLAQIIGSFFIDLLTTVVSFFVILHYSKEIAFIVLVFIPLYFIVIFIQNKKIVDQQKKVLISYAKTESNFIDSIKGVHDIKSNNKQSYFSDKNNNIYGNFQNHSYSFGKTQLHLSLLYNVTGVFFIVGILFFGAQRVINNELQLGVLMASFSLVSSIIPAISNLAMISIPINEAGIAFDRMFEYSNLRPEDNSENDQSPQFLTLELKDVSFRFPGSKLILNDINFNVNKGEIISIIGESGCGKSTLTHIIDRFYEPESGSIFVDNVINSFQFNLGNWRKSIGFVPQNPHIFNGTIAENILFEVKSSALNTLNDYLLESDLIKIINTFPQGIHTMIGESGIKLSGGQIQLIALIRALFKKPKLLVLDETTSSMDRITEKFVQNILINNKKDMAIIFVTHRLHTLKTFVDRIYIIDNCSISSFGDHNNLMKTDNLYSRFWSEFVTNNH